MAHLTPEIHVGEYYLVNGDYFPELDDAIHHANEIRKETKVFVEVEEETGVIGRLSADGYLDCTDWAEYDSVADAKAELYDETRGYAVLTLPARFASALINDDWSSTDLSDGDKDAIKKIYDLTEIVEFIDIIDDEPYFKWSNFLYSEGDNVLRYLARIDKTATV